jgi:thioredoxin-like negative regulator of GroEL
MRISSLRVALGLAVGIVAAVWPVAAAEPAAVQWRTDYHAARKEAQEKGLPVLIEIGTSDCVYCRKQDASTFRDPGIVMMLNNQFVPLRVDGNKERALVQALRVQVYPTTVLAAPDGKIVGFVQGYLSAKQLREHAKQAIFSTTTETAKEPPDRPRSAQVRDLLATARAEFRAERYAACLDHCEQVAAQFADLPEGKEASTLAAQVTSDPDRLAIVCERRNERTAALYLTLADAWDKKGQPREARLCLEKAVRLAPSGPSAERARTRLASFRRGDTPTIPTGFEKVK